MFTNLTKHDKTKLLLCNENDHCKECDCVLVSDKKFGPCCKNISCNSSRFTADDISGLDSFDSCTVFIHGSKIISKNITHHNDGVEIIVNINCDKNIEPMVISSAILVPDGCLVKAKKLLDNIYISKGDMLTIAWTINNTTC